MRSVRQCVLGYQSMSNRLTAGHLIRLVWDDIQFVIASNPHGSQLFPEIKKR